MIVFDYMHSQKTKSIFGYYTLISFIYSLYILNCFRCYTVHVVKSLSYHATKHNAHA